MDQQLIEKVMRQVSDELGIKTEECKAESAPAECAPQNIGMTEFVGTAMGDTIGLVIASVDPMLKVFMNLGKFRPSELSVQEPVPARRSGQLMRL